MEFGKETMLHASNEKREITHGRRNKTKKSCKIQNARRKGNLQILEVLEADNIEQVDMKIFKRVSQENQKITRDRTL